MRGGHRKQSFSTVQARRERTLPAACHLPTRPPPALEWKPGADFSRIAALGSPTALQLGRSAHLPACLPQLPQLQALRLDDSPRGVAVGHHNTSRRLALAELGGTLQQLTASAAAGQRLRNLVLEDVWELPPQVAALPHLETLYWVEHRAPVDAPQLSASGAYLSSLRRLALRSCVAASSTAALGAIPRFEALASWDPAPTRPPTRRWRPAWLSARRSGGLPACGAWPTRLTSDGLTAAAGAGRSMGS